MFRVTLELKYIDTSKIKTNIHETKAWTIKKQNDALVPCS